MALGVAGERDRAQAVAFDQARRQEVIAVGERTDRVVGIAADDQGSGYTRFGRRPLQEIARLGEARQTAHRDMRHRFETGMPQLGASGDDVVMRDTSRMVDEHGRAGREKLAQPFSCEVVARRDLDRAPAHQFPGSLAICRDLGRPLRLSDRRAHHPRPRLREMT